MSVILKCILGVFVVLCFVQVIEMARVRRDNAVSEGTEDLQKALNTLVDKLKNVFDDQTVKKLVDAASQTLAEGTKMAKDQLSKIGTVGTTGGADAA